MSHVEALQKNHDVLQRCTTINLYVIDFLRAKDVLDEEQESDLKAERSLLKQRILLYQWLKEVSSEKYESFLQVMKDAEQEHVTNLLIGSTEDDHLPLSDARYDRLKNIRYKMAHVTRIDTEMIAELRGAKAISMTDAEEMRAETVEYAKVSKLISAIMRRSNYCYKSFQDVLRKTIQTAAADFLSEGEMTAVHVNNNRSDLDGPLSRAFNDLVRTRTTDDAEIKNLLAEMNGLSFNPVNSKPDKSIVIFVYCKTADDAVKFTQHFNSGRVQYLLESILNRLLLTIEPHNTEKLGSRVSLDDEDVTALEKITGVEDWVREDLKRPTALHRKCGCDAITQTDDVSFKKKIKGDVPVQYNLDPTLIQMVTIKPKNNGWNAIFGMTILNKELFLSCELSKKVEVYDSMKFYTKRVWALSELNRPIDIASCNTNKCLYILDLAWPPKKNEILRVDSNGKLLNKWSTEDGYGHALSVTDDSNVILAVSSKDQINEYSPDGSLIYQITLSSEVYDPWHAVRLANDQFVVSHRSTRGVRRVCMVDEHGKLQKSFEWTYKNINDPVYLSVDGNGYILVADRDNSRVLLLDSDLEYKTKILSSKQLRLRNPGRVLLDESNRRLLVTDSDHWTVEISSFQLE